MTIINGNADSDQVRLNKSLETMAEFSVDLMKCGSDTLVNRNEIGAVNVKLSPTIEGACDLQINLTGGGQITLKDFAITEFEKFTKTFNEVSYRRRYEHSRSGHSTLPPTLP